MNELCIYIAHWSQTQFLEGHSSAEFSSNPNQTHLIQVIKVFRITRNFQVSVIWSWLELNCAELCIATDIALYCVLLYTQSTLQSWGGGGFSLTITSVQHPLGWCDGCHRTTAPVRSSHTSYRWRGERVIEPIKCVRSPHTSYRWRGERVIEPIKCVRSPHTSYRWRGEREIEPIKRMGIIRRPWLTRASGGNLARTGVILLLFTRSAMGFSMTTESQDLGLTSHPCNPCNQFTSINKPRVCLLKAEILMSRKKCHAQYICQTHSCGEKSNKHSIYFPRGT